MDTVPTHTILIVSDDVREREALVGLLRGVGHGTVVAETCEEALAAARRHLPTVALIDLWLADLPGHVVLHGVRQASPTTECIALLTNPGQQDGAYEALKLGAFTFLRRATDPRQLLNVVARAIERRELIRGVEDVKARLATLFDAIPAGVLIVDQQTRRVVDANPAAVRVVGAARQEIIGSVLQARLLTGAAGATPGGEEGAPAGLQTGRRIPATRAVATLMLGGRPHQLECFLDLSGRMEVEDRLAAAVAAYGLFTDDTRDLVMTVDRDGRLLCRYAPRDADQTDPAAVGRHAADLVPVDIRERYRLALKDLLRTGEGVSFSGGTPPFDAWAARLEPVVSRGEVLGAAVRVRDLGDGEQVRLQQRVRGVAMESVREALLVFNTEGVVLDGNEAARVMLEYTGTELVGMAFAGIEHAESPQPWSKRWSAAVLHGRVEWDTRFRRREGPLATVHVVLRHVRVDGAAVGMALVEDRTAQQQVVQAVRDAELHERALLSAVAHPFWLLDRAGRVANLNEAAARAGGKPAADLVGRLYVEVLPAAPGVAQARVHRVDDVFVRGRPVQVEDHIGPALYEVTLSPVRDRDGVIVLAAVQAREVSRERQVDERWSALWTGAPVGILVLSIDATGAATPDALVGMVVDEANPAALRFLGRSDSPPPWRLEEHLGAEEARTFGTRMREWARGEESQLLGEQIFVTASGHAAHAAVCLLRGARRAGASLSVILVVQDRTEWVESRRQRLTVGAQERQRLAATLEAAVLPALQAVQASAAVGPESTSTAWQAALATLQTRLLGLRAQLGAAGGETPALMAAFNDIAESSRDVWGLTCRCNVRAGALGADRTQVRHLCGVAREALDHAARVRRAGTATLTLSTSPGEGLLSVKDDGQAVTEDLAGAEVDIALRQMREHATAIHATLTLTPDPRGGMLMQCRFPIPA